MELSLKTHLEVDRSPGQVCVVLYMNPCKCNVCCPCCMYCMAVQHCSSVQAGHSHRAGQTIKTFLYLSNFRTLQLWSIITLFYCPWTPALFASVYNIISFIPYFTCQIIFHFQTTFNSSINHMTWLMSCIYQAARRTVFVSPILANVVLSTQSCYCCNYQRWV